MSRTPPTKQTRSRWRTLVELGAIAVAIYAFIGAPGFKDLFTSSSTSSVKPAKSLAKIESLVYPDESLDCSAYHHGYEVHGFSTRPLVVYIDGFVNDKEADALIKIRHVTNRTPVKLHVTSTNSYPSSNSWQTSTVFNAGNETIDPSVRKSEKALLPRNNLVQCLEQRALAFQGWPASTFIERLWTQRYNVSGHYAHHYDWASGSKQSRRVSTFMVYLAAPEKGGGTEFPRLKHPGNGKWCDFVECDNESAHDGIVFKAKKGAAVFWMNFDEDGRGFKETIHAGLPVEEGTKIGLNMWSWYQAGHVAI